MTEKEKLFVAFSEASEGYEIIDVINVSFNFFTQSYRMQWDKNISLEDLEDHAEKVKSNFIGINKKISELQNK